MLKDVQGEGDFRQVPLKNVGIRNLRWPLTMKDREKGAQNTVAVVSMAVDLPHDMRGTHMSRFVECLSALGPITPYALEHILDELKEKLQAERAALELEFPYFVYKKAPISGQSAPLDINCRFRAEKGNLFELYILCGSSYSHIVPLLKRNQQLWRTQSACRGQDRNQVRGNGLD
jgi:GTP cyclohydrolase I